MSIRNPLDKPVVIVAAVIGSAIGALFYNMLPLYLGMAQEYRGFDNVEIGVVGFVFFLGYNIVTISAFFWIRRFSWKVIVVITAPIAALSMMSAAMLPTFSGMLVSVFIAGGAFSAIYGLCATIISDTSHATRWYGAKIAMEGATGAILFLLLPSLVIAPYGFDGMVLALGAVVLLLSPVLFFLPVHGTKENPDINADSEEPGALVTARKAIYLMLFATLLWFCGQTVMWSFVERLGNAAGHSNDDVGIVLAVSLLAAMIGSILAAIIENRYGMLKPFIIASACFIVAAPVLASSEAYWAYLVGAVLVMFSVGLGVPYCFSIVAVLDNDGRYLVLTVPAIGIGAMIAPGVAGLLTQDGEYLQMLVFATTVVLVAVVLAIASARSAKDCQVEHASGVPLI